jgi:hypothetical protein
MLWPGSRHSAKDCIWPSLRGITLTLEIRRSRGGNEMQAPVIIPSPHSSPDVRRLPSYPEGNRNRRPSRPCAANLVLRSVPLPAFLLLRRSPAAGYPTRARRRWGGCVRPDERAAKRQDLPLALLDRSMPASHRERDVRLGKGADARHPWRAGGPAGRAGLPTPPPGFVNEVGTVRYCRVGTLRTVRG